MKNDVKSSENNALIERRRHVRGILNKLTTQNFDVLLGQFEELNVNTEDNPNAVIILVFEKAVNEPNFSTGYAVLCKHLSNCISNIESESKFITRTLITNWQYEFEPNIAETKSIKKGLQQFRDRLKKCPLTDVETINEIKASIVDEEDKKAY